MGATVSGPVMYSRRLASNNSNDLCF